MKKRLLIGLASAGIVGGATFGFAATLPVESSNLGAGGAGVASCDTDGVDVTYDVAFADGDYKVTDIHVGDISASCVGDDLSVTLSGASGGLTTVDGAAAIAGTTEDLSVTADVNAEAVTSVDVVINGNAVATD